MSNQEDARDGTGLSFSIFKYKFHNLLTEIRALKDKEQSARSEAEALVEKLRHAESSCEKLRNTSQAQVAEANDARQKLESTVKRMGLEAAAMEEKVRSLKLELATVLEARNSLTDELRVTNYELEWKLKNTTGQLAAALEKVGRHAMLIEAAQRETSSVKRVLDETRQLVNSRSDTVLELQRRLEWMSSAEQKLLDRTRLLEGELKKGASLHARDEEIAALKMALENSRSDSGRDIKLAAFQKGAEIKESQLRQIKQEKQELLRETERLKAVVNKFQEAASHQDSTLKDVREELLRHKAGKEESERRICSLQDILNKNELQINKLNTEKESLQLDCEALEKRLKLLEETKAKVDIASTASDVIESLRCAADETMQAEAGDPPSGQGAQEDSGSRPVVEEIAASQIEQCNVQPQDVDNQETRDTRDQGTGSDGVSQKPVIVDADRPMLGHSAQVADETSLHDDKADAGPFHPSVDSVDARSFHPGDVKACTCGQTASGDTAKCTGCGNEYHATCINGLSSSPEYLCTSCLDQPGTKKMRVLEPENAKW